MWMDVVRDEGKNDVVYAKERYQQQSGFSQSPKKEKRRLVFTLVKTQKS